MCAGLKAASALPSRYAIALAIWAADWTLMTSSSFLASGVIPGKAVFRLERHRVDRLRLEFPLQHQKCWIAPCKLCADFCAVGRGFVIAVFGRDRGRRPQRPPCALEPRRTNPAVPA